jgi:beta-phosphoglucomutase-like phosphatase (HAD superfamily)
LTFTARRTIVTGEMPLTYRCILIDHDDTAVDSATTIHYPAHLDALAALRPGRTPPTFDEWIVWNFHGIMEYMVDELKFTKEELLREFEIWGGWTRSRVPPFFPGFLELLVDYRAQGGRVAVISHSEASIVESHYRAVPGRPFLPDLIFGWEHDENRRKPSPWPVRESLRAFGCAAGEALIVDDLKPGLLMAQASGVAFAAAGWSHHIEEIERYMKAHALAYCARVEDLRALIMS